jgi:Tetratricopeptide repeat
VISWRGTWSIAAVVLFSSLFSRVAFAAANDAAAAKLREAAIYQDYLATDFPAAEKKLSQALALCDKPADCTAATRARLHCDLGSVYFASQKVDEARAQFSAALKEDPNVGIDPDLTTPEMQKEFAAAKGGGGKTAPATKPEPAEGTDNSDNAAPPAAGNEDTDENAEQPEPKAVVKAEGSDCPPGFPGCKSANSCSNDDDCGAGEKCVDSKCSSGEETAPDKKNWVSLAFQADLLLLPAASDVCHGGAGYSCFNTNGSWYSGTPNLHENDSVDGGMALATLRILASYDRTFGNFTAGAALGFAFRGGPSRPGAMAFLPFHGELRGKYWFGKHPLGKGFRANLMLGAGIAEVDSSIANVSIREGTTASNKDAWRKTGTGFVTAGVGIGYGFTSNTSLMLEPRFMQMFPTSGEVIGVQLAFGIGF